MKKYPIHVFEDPHSIIADDFRKLLMRVEHFDLEKNIKVIQICSANEAEGKSSVVANLSAVAVEAGKRVCIVDLDMYRPVAHKIFDLSKLGGVTEYVLSKLELNDIIKKTDCGIDVITRGEGFEFPLKLFRSNKIDNLLQELRKIYDLVIVDSSPYKLIPDTELLFDKVDGVIVVARKDRTNKDDLKQTVNSINNNKADLIGVVMNGDDSRKTKYRRNYRVHNK